MSDRLTDLLIRHEGLRLKVYTCSAGKPTIGVGRNLQDVGISKEEALAMLAADLSRVRSEASQAFPWFKGLDPVRQDIVLSMVFNLGLAGLRGFRGMIAALERHDYRGAAREMLDSRWAGQVGYRARELATMMITAKYPPG